MGLDVAGQRVRQRSGRLSKSGRYILGNLKYA